MNRMYHGFGVIAVMVYIIAVIIGGSLIPDYSHTYNTISELTASGAPKLPAVQLLFSIYNTSLLLYALGLFKEARQEPKIKAEAIMLFFVGLLGLAMYFFPQDPRGVDMTFNGKMHLALAGIMSPLTMLAMVFAGLGLRRLPVNRKLGTYSFASCIVTFWTGGASALAVAGNSAYGGLFERLTIGSFLQWLLVISLSSPHFRPSTPKSSSSERQITKL